MDSELAVVDAATVKRRTRYTNVLGVPIDSVSMVDAVARIENWIEHGERQYVCACSVHVVMLCRRSAETQKAVREAGMVTPDGMPLVWLSHLAGRQDTARVCGPDLLLACMERSVDLGHRHFFYGGEKGVADRLASSIALRYPGVNIVGSLSPPMGNWNDLCNAETVETINRSAADVVWVGLGAPKQELWMRKMRSLLKSPVLIGVGAAFNFHAGTVCRAPVWIQRSGFEWLFRLSQEPNRLWRRYFIDNSRFVFEVACQKLRLKSFDL